MPKLGEYHIVIDGKGHLLGRLASIVAKSLLEGECCTIMSLRFSSLMFLYNLLQASTSQS